MGTTYNAGGTASVAVRYLHQ